MHDFFAKNERRRKKHCASKPRRGKSSGRCYRKPIPMIEDYAVNGMCLQLSAVGGDWYDYLRLGKRLWGIALGDVCGKGMAAALLMSATRSLRSEERRVGKECRSRWGR